MNKHNGRPIPENGFVELLHEREEQATRRLGPTVVGPTGGKRLPPHREPPSREEVWIGDRRWWRVGTRTVWKENTRTIVLWSRPTSDYAQGGKLYCWKRHHDGVYTVGWYRRPPKGQGWERVPRLDK